MKLVAEGVSNPLFNLLLKVKSRIANEGDGRPVTWFEADVNGGIRKDDFEAQSGGDTKKSMCGALGAAVDGVVVLSDVFDVNND